MYIDDIDDKTISKAITDAFDFWLEQHEISFPTILGRAIEDSFRVWLMNNGGEEDIFPFVMERAIRDAASNWLRDHEEVILRNQLPSELQPRK